MLLLKELLFIAAIATSTHGSEVNLDLSSTEAKEFDVAKLENGQFTTTRITPREGVVARKVLDTTAELWAPSSSELSVKSLEIHRREGHDDLGHLVLWESSRDAPNGEESQQKEEADAASSMYKLNHLFFKKKDREWFPLTEYHFDVLKSDMATAEAVLDLDSFTERDVTVNELPDRVTTRLLLAKEGTRYARLVQRDSVLWTANSNQRFKSAYLSYSRAGELALVHLTLAAANATYDPLDEHSRRYYMDSARYFSKAAGGSWRELSLEDYEFQLGLLRKSAEAQELKVQLDLSSLHTDSSVFTKNTYKNKAMDVTAFAPNAGFRLNAVKDGARMLWVATDDAPCVRDLYLYALGEKQLLDLRLCAAGADQLGQGAPFLFFKKESGEWESLDADDYKHLLHAGEIALPLDLGRSEYQFMSIIGFKQDGVPVREIKPFRGYHFHRVVQGELPLWDSRRLLRCRKVLHFDFQPAEFVALQLENVLESRSFTVYYKRVPLSPSPPDSSAPLVDLFAPEGRWVEMSEAEYDTMFSALRLTLSFELNLETLPAMLASHAAKSGSSSHHKDTDDYEEDDDLAPKSGSSDAHVPSQTEHENFVAYRYTYKGVPKVSLTPKFTKNLSRVLEGSELIWKRSKGANCLDVSFNDSPQPQLLSVSSSDHVNPIRVSYFYRRLGRWEEVSWAQYNELHEKMARVEEPKYFTLNISDIGPTARYSYDVVYVDVPYAAIVPNFGFALARLVDGTSLLWSSNNPNGRGYEQIFRVHLSPYDRPRFALVSSITDRFEIMVSYYVKQHSEGDEGDHQLGHEFGGDKDGHHPDQNDQQNNQQPTPPDNTWKKVDEVEYYAQYEKFKSDYCSREQVVDLSDVALGLDKDFYEFENTEYLGSEDFGVLSFRRRLENLAVYYRGHRVLSVPNTRRVQEITFFPVDEPAGIVVAYDQDEESYFLRSRPVPPAKRLLRPHEEPAPEAGALFAEVEFSDFVKAVEAYISPSRRVELDLGWYYSVVAQFEQEYGDFEHYSTYATCPARVVSLFGSEGASNGFSSASASAGVSSASTAPNINNKNDRIKKQQKKDYRLKMRSYLVEKLLARYPYADAERNEFKWSVWSYRGLDFVDLQLAPKTVLHGIVDGEQRITDAELFDSFKLCFSLGDQPSLLVYHRSFDSRELKQLAFAKLGGRWTVVAALNRSLQTLVSFVSNPVSVDLYHLVDDPHRPAFRTFARESLDFVKHAVLVARPGYRINYVYYNSQLLHAVEGSVEGSVGSAGGDVAPLSQNDTIVATHSSGVATHSSGLATASRSHLRELDEDDEEAPDALNVVQVSYYPKLRPRLVHLTLSNGSAISNKYFHITNTPVYGGSDGSYDHDKLSTSSQIRVIDIFEYYRLYEQLGPVNECSLDIAAAASSDDLRVLTELVQGTEYALVKPHLGRALVLVTDRGQLLWEARGEKVSSVLLFPRADPKLVMVYYEHEPAGSSLLPAGPLDVHGQRVVRLMYSESVHEWLEVSEEMALDALQLAKRALRPFNLDLSAIFSPRGALPHMWYHLERKMLYGLMFSVVRPALGADLVKVRYRDQVLFDIRDTYSQKMVSATIVTIETTKGGASDSTGDSAATTSYGSDSESSSDSDSDDETKPAKTTVGIEDLDKSTTTDTENSVKKPKTKTKRYKKYFNNGNRILNVVYGFGDDPKLARVTYLRNFEVLEAYFLRRDQWEEISAPEFGRYLYLLKRFSLVPAVLDVERPDPAVFDTLEFVYGGAGAPSCPMLRLVPRPKYHITKLVSSERELDDLLGEHLPEQTTLFGADDVSVMYVEKTKAAPVLLRVYYVDKHELLRLSKAHFVKGSHDEYRRISAFEFEKLLDRAALTVYNLDAYYRVLNRERPVHRFHSSNCAESPERVFNRSVNLVQPPQGLDRLMHRESLVWEAGVDEQGLLLATYPFEAPRVAMVKSFDHASGTLCARYFGFNGGEWVLERVLRNGVVDVSSSVSANTNTNNNNNNAKITDSIHIVDETKVDHSNAPGAPSALDALLQSDPDALEFDLNDQRLHLGLSSFVFAEQGVFTTLVLPSRRVRVRALYDNQYRIWAPRRRAEMQAQDDLLLKDQHDKSADNTKTLEKTDKTPEKTDKPALKHDSLDDSADALSAAQRPQLQEEELVKFYFTPSTSPQLLVVFYRDLEGVVRVRDFRKRFPVWEEAHSRFMAHYLDMLDSSLSVNLSELYLRGADGDSLDSDDLLDVLDSTANPNSTANTNSTNPDFTNKRKNYDENKMTVVTYPLSGLQLATLNARANHNVTKLLANGRAGQPQLLWQSSFDERCFFVQFAPPVDPKVVLVSHSTSKMFLETKMFYRDPNSGWTLSGASDHESFVRKLLELERAFVYRLEDTLAGLPNENYRYEDTAFSGVRFRVCSPRAGRRMVKVLDRLVHVYERAPGERLLDVLSTPPESPRFLLMLYSSGGEVKYRYFKKLAPSAAGSGKFDYAGMWREAEFRDFVELLERSVEYKAGPEFSPLADGAQAESDPENLAASGLDELHERLAGLGSDRDPQSLDELCRGVLQKMALRIESGREASESPDAEVTGFAQDAEFLDDSATPQKLDKFNRFELDLANLAGPEFARRDYVEAGTPRTVLRIKRNNMLTALRQGDLDIWSVATGGVVGGSTATENTPTNTDNTTTTDPNTNKNKQLLVTFVYFAPSYDPKVLTLFFAGNALGVAAARFVKGNRWTPYLLHAHDLTNEHMLNHLTDKLELDVQWEPVVFRNTELYRKLFVADRSAYHMRIELKTAAKSVARLVYGEQTLWEADETEQFEAATVYPISAPRFVRLDVRSPSGPSARFYRNYAGSWFELRQRGHEASLERYYRHASSEFVEVDLSAPESYRRSNTFWRVSASKLYGLDFRLLMPNNGYQVSRLVYRAPLADPTPPAAPNPSEDSFGLDDLARIEVRDCDPAGSGFCVLETVHHDAYVDIFLDDDSFFTDDGNSGEAAKGEGNSAEVNSDNNDDLAASITVKDTPITVKDNGSAADNTTTNANNNNNAATATVNGPTLKTHKPKHSRVEQLFEVTRNEFVGSVAFAPADDPRFALVTAYSAANMVPATGGDLFSGEAGELLDQAGREVDRQLYMSPFTNYYYKEGDAWLMTDGFSFMRRCKKFAHDALEPLTPFDVDLDELAFNHESYELSAEEFCGAVFSRIVPRRGFQIAHLYQYGRMVYRVGEFPLLQLMFYPREHPRFFKITHRMSESLWNNYFFVSHDPFGLSQKDYPSFRKELFDYLRPAATPGVSSDAILDLASNFDSITVVDSASPVDSASAPSTPESGNIVVATHSEGMVATSTSTSDSVSVTSTTSGEHVSATTTSAGTPEQENKPFRHEPYDPRVVLYGHNEKKFEVHTGDSLVTVTPHHRFLYYVDPDRRSGTAYSYDYTATALEFEYAVKTFAGQLGSFSYYMVAPTRDFAATKLYSNSEPLVGADEAVRVRAVVCSPAAEPRFMLVCFADQERAHSWRLFHLFEGQWVEMRRTAVKLKLKNIAKAHLAELDPDMFAAASLPTAKVDMSSSSSSKSVSFDPSAGFELLAGSEPAADSQPSGDLTAPAGTFFRTAEPEKRNDLFLLHGRVAGPERSDAFSYDLFNFARHDDPVSDVLGKLALYTESEEGHRLVLLDEPCFSADRVSVNGVTVFDLSNSLNVGSDVGAQSDANTTNTNPNTNNNNNAQNETAAEPTHKTIKAVMLCPANNPYKLHVRFSDGNATRYASFLRVRDSWAPVSLCLTDELAVRTKFVGAELRSCSVLFAGDFPYAVDVNSRHLLYRFGSFVHDSAAAGRWFSAHAPEPGHLVYLPTNNFKLVRVSFGKHELFRYSFNTKSVSAVYLTTSVVDRAEQVERVTVFARDLEDRKIRASWRRSGSGWVPSYVPTEEVVRMLRNVNAAKDLLPGPSASPSSAQSSALESSFDNFLDFTAPSGPREFNRFTLSGRVQRRDGPLNLSAFFSYRLESNEMETFVKALDTRFFNFGVLDEWYNYNIVVVPEGYRATVLSHLDEVVYDARTAVHASGFGSVSSANGAGAATATSPNTNNDGVDSAGSPSTNKITDHDKNYSIKAVYLTPANNPYRLYLYLVNAEGDKKFRYFWRNTVSVPSSTENTTHFVSVGAKHEWVPAEMSGAHLSGVKAKFYKAVHASQSLRLSCYSYELKLFPHSGAPHAAPADAFDQSVHSFSSYKHLSRFDYYVNADSGVYDGLAYNGMFSYSGEDFRVLVPYDRNRVSRVSYGVETLFALKSQFHTVRALLLSPAANPRSLVVYYVDEDDCDRYAAFTKLNPMLYYCNGAQAARVHALFGGQSPKSFEGVKPQWFERPFFGSHLSEVRKIHAALERYYRVYPLASGTATSAVRGGSLARNLGSSTVVGVDSGPSVSGSAVAGVSDSTPTNGSTRPEPQQKQLRWDQYNMELYLSGEYYDLKHGKIYDFMYYYDPDHKTTLKLMENDTVFDYDKALDVVVREGKLSSFLFITSREPVIVHSIVYGDQELLAVDPRNFVVGLMVAPLHDPRAVLVHLKDMAGADLFYYYAKRDHRWVVPDTGLNNFLKLKVLMESVRAEFDLADASAFLMDLKTSNSAGFGPLFRPGASLTPVDRDADAPEYPDNSANKPFSSASSDAKFRPFSTSRVFWPSPKSLDVRMSGTVEANGQTLPFIYFYDPKHVESALVSENGTLVEHKNVFAVDAEDSLYRNLFSLRPLYSQYQVKKLHIGSEQVLQIEETTSLNLLLWTPFKQPNYLMVAVTEQDGVDSYRFYARRADGWEPAAEDQTLLSLAAQFVSGPKQASKAPHPLEKVNYDVYLTGLVDYDNFVYVYDNDKLDTLFVLRSDSIVELRNAIDYVVDQDANVLMVLPQLPRYVVTNVLGSSRVLVSVDQNSVLVATATSPLNDPFYLLVCMMDASGTYFSFFTKDAGKWAEPHTMPAEYDRLVEYVKQFMKVSSSPAAVSSADGGVGLGGVGVGVSDGGASVAAGGAQHLVSGAEQPLTTAQQPLLPDGTDTRNAKQFDFDLRTDKKSTKFYCYWRTARLLGHEYAVVLVRPHNLLNRLLDGALLLWQHAGDHYLVNFGLMPPDEPTHACLGVYHLLDHTLKYKFFHKSGGEWHDHRPEFGEVPLPLRQLPELDLASVPELNERNFVLDLSAENASCEHFQLHHDYVDAFGMAVGFVREGYSLYKLLDAFNEADAAKMSDANHVTVFENFNSINVIRFAYTPVKNPAAVALAYDLAGSTMFRFFEKTNRGWGPMYGMTYLRKALLRAVSDEYHEEFLDRHHNELAQTSTSASVSAAKPAAAPAADPVLERVAADLVSGVFGQFAAKQDPEDVKEVVFDLQFDFVADFYKYRYDVELTLYESVAFHTFVPRPGVLVRQVTSAFKHVYSLLQEERLNKISLYPRDSPELLLVYVTSYDVSSDEYVSGDDISRLLGVNITRKFVLDKQAAGDDTSGWVFSEAKFDQRLNELSYNFAEKASQGCVVDLLSLTDAQSEHFYVVRDTLNDAVDALVVHADAAVTAVVEGSHKLWLADRNEHLDSLYVFPVDEPELMSLLTSANTMRYFARRQNRWEPVFEDAFNYISSFYSTSRYTIDLKYVTDYDEMVSAPPADLGSASKPSKPHFGADAGSLGFLLDPFTLVQSSMSVSYTRTRYHEFLETGVLSADGQAFGLVYPKKDVDNNIMVLRHAGDVIYRFAPGERLDQLNYHPFENPVMLAMVLSVDSAQDVEYDVSDGVTNGSGSSDGGSNYPNASTDASTDPTTTNSTTANNNNTNNTTTKVLYFLRSALKSPTSWHQVDADHYDALFELNRYAAENGLGSLFGRQVFVGDYDLPPENQFSFELAAASRTTPSYQLRRLSERESFYALVVNEGYKLVEVTDAGVRLFRAAERDVIIDLYYSLEPSGAQLTIKYLTVEEDAKFLRYLYLEKSGGAWANRYTFRTPVKSFATRQARPASLAPVAFEFNLATGSSEASADYTVEELDGDLAVSVADGHRLVRLLDGDQLLYSAPEGYDVKSFYYSPRNAPATLAMRFKKADNKNLTYHVYFEKENGVWDQKKISMAEDSAMAESSQLPADDEAPASENAELETPVDMMASGSFNSSLLDTIASAVSSGAQASPALDAEVKEFVYDLNDLNDESDDFNKMFFEEFDLEIVQPNGNRRMVKVVEGSLPVFEPEKPRVVRALAHEGIHRVPTFVALLTNLGDDRRTEDFSTTFLEKFEGKWRECKLNFFDTSDVPLCAAPKVATVKLDVSHLVEKVVADYQSHVLVPNTRLSFANYRVGPKVNVSSVYDGDQLVFSSTMSNVESVKLYATDSDVFLRITTELFDNETTHFYRHSLLPPVSNELETAQPSSKHDCKPSSKHDCKPEYFEFDLSSDNHSTRNYALEVVDFGLQKLVTVKVNRKSVLTELKDAEAVVWKHCKKRFMVEFGYLPPQQPTHLCLGVYQLSEHAVLYTFYYKSDGEWKEYHAEQSLPQALVELFNVLAPTKQYTSNEPKFGQLQHSSGAVSCETFFKFDLAADNHTTDDYMYRVYDFQGHVVGMVIPRRSKFPSQVVDGQLAVWTNEGGKKAKAFVYMSPGDPQQFAVSYYLDDRSVEFQDFRVKRGDEWVPDVPDGAVAAEAMSRLNLASEQSTSALTRSVAVAKFDYDLALDNHSTEYYSFNVLTYNGYKYALVCVKAPNLLLRLLDGDQLVWQNEGTESVMNLAYVPPEQPQQLVMSLYSMSSHSFYELFFYKLNGVWRLHPNPGAGPYHLLEVQRLLRLNHFSLNLAERATGRFSKCSVDFDGKSLLELEQSAYLDQVLDGRELVWKNHAGKMVKSLLYYPSSEPAHFAVCYMLNQEGPFYEYLEKRGGQWEHELVPAEVKSLLSTADFFSASSASSLVGPSQPAPQRAWTRIDTAEFYDRFLNVALVGSYSNFDLDLVPDEGLYEIKDGFAHGRPFRVYNPLPGNHVFSISKGPARVWAFEQLNEHVKSILAVYDRFDANPHPRLLQVYIKNRNALELRYFKFGPVWAEVDAKEYLQLYREVVDAFHARLPGPPGELAALLQLESSMEEVSTAAGSDDESPRAQRARLAELGKHFVPRHKLTLVQRLYELLMQFVRFFMRSDPKSKPIQAASPQQPEKTDLSPATTHQDLSFNYYRIDPAEPINVFVRLSDDVIKMFELRNNPHLVVHQADENTTVYIPLAHELVKVKRANYVFYSYEYATKRVVALTTETKRGVVTKLVVSLDAGESLKHFAFVFGADDAWDNYDLDEAELETLEEAIGLAELKRYAQSFQKRYLRPQTAN